MNPCKSGLHTCCANEHNMKFSTVAPSSSEKDLPSSASEEVTGSKSTTSSWMVGSFFRRKKKELTMWPIFTRSIPSASVVRKTSREQGASQTCRRLLVSSTLNILSPSIQKSSIPPNARAKASEPRPLTSPLTRCSWCTLATFQTFQRLCQGSRWAFFS